MIQHSANGVTVFQSSLYNTTSTVLETSSFVLVVDPTWLPEEVEEIRRFASDIRGSRPLYLLFTHSDWDHIIGYKAFPDAVTIGSRVFDNHPDKVGILEQICTFDSRKDLRRNYEIAYPVIDIVIQKDGQQLHVGDSTFTFYLAPGHTECGIFCIIEPYGLFLAGDYLSNIEFPYIYFDSRSYEETLHKVGSILQSHKINLLVPGHGQCTSEELEIRRRHQTSLNYIQTLRELLKEDQQQSIDRMLLEYDLPGMKSSHEYNQTIIKRELGID